jgi:hypothetical protein
MKRLACALTVFSLTMMGCGGSLCEDVADTFTNIQDKVADCPSYNGITFTKPTDAEIQQCEDSLSSCTDNDKKIMNAYIDCINGLPKCTASTEQSFSDSLVACAAPTANVSDACGATTSDSLPRQIENFSRMR